MHEKVALILEVIAFFLVTTDLYGEERLRNLTEMLSKKRRDIIHFLVHLPFWLSKLMSAGLTSTLPKINLLAILFIDWYYIWNFTEKYVSQLILLMIINLIIMVILIPVLPLIILLSGFVLLSISSLVLLGLFTSVSLLKVSGWMLVVGAILFLISKGITFWFIGAGEGHAVPR